MPAQHSLHVALTAEFCDFIARLVASGRYQSSSEVVRASLRLLDRAEAELNAARKNAHNVCTECRR